MWRSVSRSLTVVLVQNICLYYPTCVVLVYLRNSIVHIRTFNEITAHRFTRQTTIFVAVSNRWNSARPLIVKDERRINRVPLHFEHKVHIYLEYHSFCPLVRKGGGNTCLWMRGWRAQCGRLEEKHRTLFTLWPWESDIILLCDIKII
jgi:hypothetical protein